jgi:hypothetical protein
MPDLIAIALGGTTRRIQHQVAWLHSLAIISCRRQFIFAPYFQWFAADEPIRHKQNSQKFTFTNRLSKGEKQKPRI